MDIQKINQFVKEQSVYPVDCYYREIKKLDSFNYDNLSAIFGIQSPFSNEEEAVAFANDFVDYIEFEFIDSFFKRDSLATTLRYFMFYNMPYHFGGGYFQHSFKNKFTTIEDFIKENGFIRENVYFYFFDLLFFHGKTDFSKTHTFFFKSKYEFSATLSVINEEVKSLPDYEELYSEFQQFQMDNIEEVCEKSKVPF